MTAPQTIAVAILTIAAAIIAILFILSWLAKVGGLSGEVEHEETPQEADERISTIKAALQEEAVTPNRHMSAKNYWSVP